MEVCNDNIDLEGELPELHRTFQGIQMSRMTKMFGLCWIAMRDLGYILVPSFLRNDENPKVKKREDIVFLDGLRGLAAFTVYMDHLLTPIYPNLRYRYHQADTSSILQIPFLRLIYSGDAMVASFFIISGVVLSKKASRLFEQENFEQAYHVLAASTFKRGFRLYIPPILSTFVVMLLCRANLFDKSFLLRLHAPHPTRFSYWQGQFQDWISFVFGFLLNPWQWYPKGNSSNYGNHLWTISVEMNCSMHLFLALLVLGRLRRIPLVIIVVILISFNIGIQKYPLALFYFGMLQAFTRNWSSPKAPRILTEKRFKLIHRVLGLLSVIFGLYLASYPQIADNYHSGLFQSNSLVYWNIGAMALVGGLFHEPFLQRLLSGRLPQYLGRISFSMYILHEPILQIFGWRCFLSVKNAPLLYDSPDIVRFVPLLATWLLLTALIVFMSDIFRRLVDLPSIYFANWLALKLSRYDEVV